MAEAEEEEVIILVELTGLPNPDVIHDCRGTCAVLGIDTAEPVLQLDKYVFKGRFEDTLGTCLFFKQDPETKKLSYHCKSSKKLAMSRVILKKKEGSRDTNASATSVKSEHTSSGSDA